MSHECIQVRRLFIIERDLQAERAKREDQYQKLLETLGRISEGITSLGSNTSRDLSALRKEVGVLTKMVKKNGG